MFRGIAGQPTDEPPASFADAHYFNEAIFPSRQRHHVLAQETRRERRSFPASAGNARGGRKRSDFTFAHVHYFQPQSLTTFFLQFFTEQNFVTCIFFRSVFRG